MNLSPVLIYVPVFFSLFIYFFSPNLVRMRCKTYVFYYLIRDVWLTSSTFLIRHVLFVFKYTIASGSEFLSLSFL